MSRLPLDSSDCSYSCVGYVFFWSVSSRLLLPTNCWVPSQAKPSQAKPSQAKVLTRGGDLREAQVFVPPVCLPFLLLTALLGTVTDFLTLMGNMLTLTFLKSG
jgi:hypothetical protein